MPSRFRFKGSAYGAAGVLTTPYNEIIQTQASSNLSDIGGHGVGRSENFSHRNILRFDLAHTEVTGSRTHLDDTSAVTYSTLVKATIEGLNIMGMVTADRVVANLVSTFRHVEGEKDTEPSVRLIGSRFENLRIAGIPVKVCLNLDVLDRYHHHKDLKAAFSSGEKIVRDLFGGDDLKARHPKAPKEVKAFLDAPPEDGSEMPSTLSIVRKLEPECDAFECFGHVIHIEGFGTIRLGEIQICRTTRELTMVQVKLGCPVEGQACCGSVGGVGSDGN